MGMTKNDSVPRCRDSLSWKTREEFYLSSCAYCYHYLFKNGTVLELDHATNVLKTKDYILPNTSYFTPDVNDDLMRTAICGFLDTEGCSRWQECCQSAQACCEKQMSADGNNPQMCPATWDGWLCWRETSSMSVTREACPEFVDGFYPSDYAKKRCLENGTWFGHHYPGGMYREYTDYTPCVGRERYLPSFYLGLGCNLLSIVFLVPALCIFLLYRTLRRQHRIRLHVNFFLSFIFSNLFLVIWDIVIEHTKLTADDPLDTVVEKNGVGCRMLAFFKIYFASTNYMWMFCEGMYLYRLISNAFSPPTSLLPIYIAGWGCPMVWSLVYAIIRGAIANTSCWATPYGNYEWIIFLPNLLCLFVNFIFLCNIVRVLVTQIQNHPNEPSNFRRALKATFVLIPLFGIHLFVSIYRPSDRSQAAANYEKFTEFIQNSQGFFVAMIFCFANGEVLALLRKSLPCQSHNRASAEMRQLYACNSSVTQVTNCNVNFDRPDTSLLPQGNDTHAVDGDKKTSNGKDICTRNDMPFSNCAYTAVNDSTDERQYKQ